MSSRILLAPALALLVVAGCNSSVTPDDLVARLRNSPPRLHRREAGRLPGSERHVLSARAGAGHRLFGRLLPALHLPAAV